MSVFPQPNPGRSVYNLKEAGCDAENMPWKSLCFIATCCDAAVYRTINTEGICMYSMQTVKSKY